MACPVLSCSPFCFSRPYFYNLVCVTVVYMVSFVQYLSCGIPQAHYIIYGNKYKITTSWNLSIPAPISPNGAENLRSRLCTRPCQQQSKSWSRYWGKGFLCFAFPPKAVFFFFFLFPKDQIWWFISYSGWSQLPLCKLSSSLSHTPGVW